MFHAIPMQPARFVAAFARAALPGDRRTRLAPWLVGLTLAGVGLIAPSVALAISDNNLGPAEDPAAAGVATVLGGDFEGGCLGAVVDERWVLTLESVMHGSAHSCVGADGTTVQVGERTFDVVEVVRGASSTNKRGYTATPVMLRVADPMTDITINAIARAPIAETNGTRRGMLCTGRRAGELRSSRVWIGSKNDPRDVATWYLSTNNRLIANGDRGATLSAPLDVAAPCWHGDALVAMVAVIPTGLPAFAHIDELGTDAYADWVESTIASYVPLCDLSGDWQKRYDLRANGVLDGRIITNEITLAPVGDHFTGHYIGATASNPSVFTASCVEHADSAEVTIHQQHGWYWSVIEAVRVGDVMTGVWYDRRGNRGDIELMPW